MKKYVIPLLLFATLTFLMTPSLFAVDNTKKGYVEGGVGLSNGKTITAQHMNQNFISNLNARYADSNHPNTHQTSYELKNDPMDLNLEAGYYLNSYLSLGFTLGYLNLELKELRDYALDSSTGAFAKTSDPSIVLNVTKLRALINVAYHYNIMEELNLFVSPAIGFDSNFVNYNSDHAEDAFTELAKGINFTAKGAVGGIYYISDTIYTKGSISYNLSSPMFHGVSTKHLLSYKGKVHTWEQFDIAVGTRF